ncbi:tRNA lysidine(34) synthetase TilS [Hellea balneolensis]|uniref:tRNA lysidine(34) synthetase TilS n=1 Tax=Hellea balneolensis TaxID=287478 RepID=UPI000413BD02|nr:tRNA lysidine(34) synthetase TilS [Hellea balneolensis]
MSLTSQLYRKIDDLIPKGEAFAIASSGGGDSTALVHALREHPQANFVYIVDHNLRAGSCIEAKDAKAFAKECGYKAKVLTWSHDRPQSGLQEKARCARYALMGAQCRTDGIKYLLTAHHKDDQAETLLMRYERKTDWRGAAGMAEFTYAPIWPELAMVNIVRPLLERSRADLRGYNREHKLSWAEDPSNQNRDFARIRARDELTENTELKCELLNTAENMKKALNKEREILRQDANKLKVDEMGLIHLSSKPLPELMFQCLRAASGLGQHIDRAKLKRLLKMMGNSSFKSATLCGAMIAKEKSRFIICRDPVAVTGRRDGGQGVSAGPMPLSKHYSIWDGRWAVKSTLPNISIAAQYSLDNPRDSRGPAHKITQPILRRKSDTQDEFEIFESMNLQGVDTTCLVQTRLDAALCLKTP